MTKGPAPSRTPRHRRYPLTSYIPFLLLLLVPLALLIALGTLLAHLLAPGTPAHPSSGYKTPTAAAAIGPAPTTVSRPAGHTPLATAHVKTRSTPLATATISATAGISATPSITVAESASASRTPVRPSTVFRGRFAQLYAFGIVSAVRPGDTVRFVWRDLTRHTVITDYPIAIHTAQAAYRASMYAYPGRAPDATNPFPVGAYQVDLYHGTARVATGRFTVASLQTR